MREDTIHPNQTLQTLEGTIWLEILIFKKDKKKGQNLCAYP